MEHNITETMQLLDELNALMDINIEERARQNRTFGESSARNAVIPEIQTEQNAVNLARRARRDRLSLSRRIQTVSNFLILALK